MSSRLVFAAGAGVVLAGVVVAVALGGGGGDESERMALDPTCVEAWNDDPVALAYGRHNFNFHDYEAALVTHLDAAANEVPAGDASLCAVIFPSRALDPEPFAAGEVLRDGAWVAISDLPGVEVTRVAELQAKAAESANVAIDGQGSLGELPPEGG